MKPTIAIFIHDPQCETECALGMIEGLVHDFDIRTFGLDSLTYDFLAEFDVVCFPGGMGDSDDFYKIFSDSHIWAVQEYVTYGGKYFGICMGAYWAGPDYFNIVDNLVVTQYIERPDSDIKVDTPTVANITWPDRPYTMYFYDGCVLLGDELDVFATYANGEAMAGIQGNVGMIGCHPEALPWWYEQGNMPNYYKNSHSRLMSDFVICLVNS